MSIELTVPEVGESITEVQIGRWLHEDGATVRRDDDLVEIETDKASVVVAAPEDGVLSIVTAEGEFAPVGATIARITAADDSSPARKVAMEAPTGTSATTDRPQEADEATDDDARVMPAAARALDDHELDASAVTATGPGGRLLKEDVQRHVQAEDARQAARAALADQADPAASRAASSAPAERGEEVRPMSMIRRTIAARLVEAQQSAALLTTFNEVDMSAVKELRARYRDDFEKRYGLRLGFMAFFVKAAVEALGQFPAVNAEVRGTDIVYRNYCDIGIAIGGGKGLVVPVLRNADGLSFAEIERQIADFGARAQDNKIQPEELAGGTFTISNGGVYGSLLSTPIVNPPQSGILGMHAIQDRPVARDGEVVIRPMMYLAFTYDHRIVDGREAVTFLRSIRNVLEDPARLILGI